MIFPRRETLQRPPQKCGFGLQKIILWDVVGTNCIVIPEKRFGPVSSLSVTGQNDEATGLEETSSDSEINPNNHVRGATNKDRDLDRRSDLAKREQDGRAAGCRIEGADHATKRRNDVQRQGGRR